MMNTHQSFGDIIRQSASPNELGESASQEALIAAG